MSDDRAPEVADLGRYGRRLVSRFVEKAREADRPRFANQWKGSEPGALYVSIHNNSGVSAAHGFETYFLADASTADERRVADMENASVKYEKSTAPAGTGLDQVLNGLRNDFYMRTSNAFADVVQRNMAEFHPGPNRGGPTAPSASYPVASTSSCSIRREDKHARQAASGSVFPMPR